MLILSSYTDENLCSKPGVYLIVNTKNNKFYIGSSKNIKKRTGSHFSDLRNNKHRNSCLQRAYKKDSQYFKKFVYCYCETYKEIEQELLDKYWDNKVNCYNLSKDAIGNNLTDAGRHLLSEKNKRFHKDNPSFVLRMMETEEWQKRTEDFKEQVKDPEFQANRIEASIKAHEKLFDVWVINIETKQKEYVGLNLAKFCRRHNIQNGNMLSVLQGARNICKGWMLLAKYENPEPKKLRNISPEGRKVLSEKMIKMHKEHPEILQKVAEKNKTPEMRKHRSDLAKKQRTNPEYNANLLAHISKAKQKFWDVTVIDPDGNSHYIGWNLTQFCKKHFLNMRNMGSVIRGITKSHKGWRLFK